MACIVQKLLFDTKKKAPILTAYQKLKLSNTVRSTTICKASHWSEFTTWFNPYKCKTELAKAEMFEQIMQIKKNYLHKFPRLKIKPTAERR